MWVKLGLVWRYDKCIFIGTFWKKLPLPFRGVINGNTGKAVALPQPGGGADYAHPLALPHLKISVISLLGCILIHTLNILGKAHNTPTQRTERCAKPDFKLTPEAMKAINARKAQLQTGFPKKAIPAPINTGAFWQDFVWYYYILK